LAQALADALGEASADADAADDGATEPAAEALGDVDPPVEQAARTRVVRRTIDDFSALRIRVLLEFWPVPAECNRTIPSDVVGFQSLRMATGRSSFRARSRAASP
jgi:hypothetical protein